jgi:hypothetical protein
MRKTDLKVGRKGSEERGGDEEERPFRALE